MNNTISICGAALLAAAMTTPAGAQVVVQQGTYSGSTADGQGLSFTVGTDSNNGLTAVTGANISFNAPCNGDEGYTLNTDWSFGVLQDIKPNGRTGKFTPSFNYYYFDITLVFSADGTATGTITSYSPTLYQVGIKPARALLCISPDQALSLTLQPPSDTVDRPKANVHTIDSNGVAHQ
jgi:hypothetical protein